MGRLLRWFLIFSIIIVGAFLIANAAVERIAQSRVASAVKTEFHLAERPKVDIRGFPIIVQLLKGNVPHLTFRATRANFDELVIEEVSADFEGIEAPNGFFSADLRITVRQGEIRARATQDAVNDYLRARGEDATLAFHEGRVTVRAVRSFFGAKRTFTASGTIRREGSELVFHPTSVRIDGQEPPGVLEAAAKERATVRVTLPSLPGGLAIYRFTPADGALQVTAILRNTTLALLG